MQHPRQWVRLIKKKKTFDREKQLQLKLPRVGSGFGRTPAAVAAVPLNGGSGSAPRTAPSAASPAAVRGADRNRRYEPVAPDKV